jgi:ArsR family transcriptional regulator, virulence genes transcriptional regulator
LSVFWKNLFRFRILPLCFSKTMAMFPSQIGTKKNINVPGDVGTDMTPEELLPKSGKAADLLGALANQKRLMIMAHLFVGELSVNNLAAKVNLSQSALSQHLAKLRNLGLVDTRREGQTIFYRATSGEAVAIVETLCKVLPA